MLRARTSDGNFIFGIDEENVRRLKAGKPIVVDLATMGGTGKVAICYGTTLADIAKQLEADYGPLPPAQPLPDTNVQ